MQLRALGKRLFRMSRRERAWAAAALGAVYPPLPEANVPGIQGLGLEAFLDDFEASAPVLAVLGLRGATAFVALAPPFVLRRACTILGLDADERDERVARLAASPLYTVRQLVTLLKATGAFLYGAAPAVRMHMGEGPLGEAEPALLSLAHLLRPRAA